MQIGKYSLEQLLQASLFDKDKIKFGFWGAFIGALAYVAFQTLAVTLLPNKTVHSLWVSLGDFFSSLIMIGTILGLTFSFKDSLGGKKKKAIPIKKLISLSLAKLPLAVGMIVLYLGVLLLVVMAEIALYLFGQAPVWGSLILGIGTVPLVLLNLVLLVMFIFGLKLLPAFLVTEKGRLWESFIKLNKMVINKIVQIAAYFGLLLFTMIPFIAILAMLFWPASYIVLLVQKAAFQKILLAGGYVEWPSIVFGLLTGVSYLAIGVLAASYLLVYATAAIYSIYLAVKTK